MKNKKIRSVFAIAAGATVGRWLGGGFLLWNHGQDDNLFITVVLEFVCFFLMLCAAYCGRTMREKRRKKNAEKESGK